GRKQLARLVGPRDAGSCNAIRRQRNDLGVAELNNARIRLVEAANQIQRRRLAGTVRSNDTGNFSGTRPKTQLPDRLDAAEGVRSRTYKCCPTLSDVRKPWTSRRIKGASFAQGLDQRRPNRPINPVRAILSTASMSTPTNSRRYWPSVDSASGSSTTMTAPISGPNTVSMPPTMTRSRSRID